MTRESNTSAPGLPAGWEPGRDLLVWVGPGTGEPPERITASARALAFLPGGARDAASPGGTRVLRTQAELFQAILALPGVLPMHVAVQRDGRVDPGLQREVAELVKKALRSKAMQMRTVASSGTTWLLQGLANLPAIAAHASIAPLRGALAGWPCVLVSPGPSLARNVEQLAEFAGRALIVSGTHALHALQAAGVVPDLVLCADPGDLARHWRGVALEDVPAFVIGATCRPEAFAVPCRRRFAFASNAALDDWIFSPLGEDARLATGGSVSCSQLSLALFLGCDPIAFVGQDLSFTERFYAASGLDGDARVELAGERAFVLKKPRGASGPGTTLPDGSVQFTIPQEILTVPGWSGGTVRTTPQLKSFLDWFEALAPSLRGHTRLMNCTEGGAHIAGMEHLPLAEACAGWSERAGLDPLLERAATSFDPGARRARLARAARAASASLQRAVVLARRCTGLARRGGSSLERLRDCERELAGALRGDRLFSLVAQDEIVQASEAARRARTLAESLEAGQRLYRVVEQAGALLADPLRSALAALEG